MARALAILLLLVFSLPAAARRSDVHTYRFEQVWGSAVRMVRVDYGFELRDRDEDIGYLLFDYRDSGRTYPGSLELVRIEERGQPAVRVTLQIPAMPSYVEQMMLDKLGRKLREDHGQPLAPPRETPPSAPEEPSEEPAEESRAPREEPSTNRSRR